MRFYHFADLHLGFRQYGLESRKRAFTEAFLQAMVSVREARPQAVVVAGDIFEKDIRSSTLEAMVRSEVGRVEAMGIPVMGVEGNHDFAGDDSTLKICDIRPLDDRVETVDGIRFTGINFSGRKNPKLLMERLAQLPPADVLVMHQMLNEVCSIGGDISASDMAAAVKGRGVRYVAMGDAHDNWMTELAGVTLAYPGSLEMTDIDEGREKLFLEVDISQNPKLPYLCVKQMLVPCQRISRLTMNTEEECEALIAQAKKNPDALYYLSVNRKLAHMIVRIESALRGRGIAVTTKSHSDVVGGTGGADIKPFERASTGATLVSVIGEVFGAGDPRAGLAQEIAEQPDRMIEICNAFLKGAAT